MGRFGSTFGVRGWIKVTSFTDPIENLLQYTSWWIRHRNKWQVHQVKDSKTHNKLLIVKLAGYDTPETVNQFTNDLIAIERTNLPTLNSGEYYWADLIGLRVITQKGVELGHISSLIETPSNDVLVIHNHNKHEILIPYLKSVVKSVDLDKKVLTVHWEED